MSSFIQRHIGPSESETQEMLKFLALPTLDRLIDQTVPEQIRLKHPLSKETLGEGVEEDQALADLKGLAKQNKLFKSFIGMGYSGCITPPVILRNILENPGWYTQYTPYQAEISQGRLEALINFQTMISDLTAMEIANASMLDEGTAAAEALSMCAAVKNADGSKKAVFVSENCFPQTIEIVRTRAEASGLKVIVGDPFKFDFKTPVCGFLVQYPSGDGRIFDYKALVDKVHAADAMVVVAADLMSLVLLTPPGEWGADVVVGSAQRFGVPMGYGGPHAAYLATRDAYKRQIPGRLIGVSKDLEGKAAYRLALQTREQHIRRDKATSNICTAQVLLAVMASMYSVYHGPKGLKKIASRIAGQTGVLAEGLKKLGYELAGEHFFDTLCVNMKNHSIADVLDAAYENQINLRVIDKTHLGVSIDETTSHQDIELLLKVFNKGKAVSATPWGGRSASAIQGFERKSKFLTHPTFNSYHSETEMLRYLRRLEAKDLSLGHSMIPLGSCTMKLNATTEMLPVTWEEWGSLHPFIPRDQAQGYTQLTERLEKFLSEITGFAATSLQPNAGSQGEYAGLLVIRKYQESRGQGHRNVCLIPQSAHGTNPASAVLAGFKVVVVACDSQGNIDLKDLQAKANEHSQNLSALMVTYPSTHGVFEEGIKEICDVVHSFGGQVYMDGANMNAQVGLCRPGDFGPDVCHLNLHKTFCIPHGGGGPGMGPICVKAHLASYLPKHPLVPMGGKDGIGAISAAPWGSASILPISYLYIVMMGAEGLKRATQIAILNANYIAKRLQPHFPVLYKGKNGFVAHECIVDLRHLKPAVEVEDVAKRLMDYGFHAPTVSFPVAGTLMIEPTESESKAELDRFCDAMISIRREIEEVELGKADPKNNVLKNAPHTVDQVSRTEWNRPYAREKAAFPLPWVRDRKFWPSVSRIDNVYGDRNVMCMCPPIEEYSS